MELTLQEQQVLLNIVMNGRYLPDEWENMVKPIVIKLKSSLGAQPNGNPV